MREFVIYCVGACTTVTEEEGIQWRRNTQQYFKSLDTPMHDKTRIRVINIGDYFSTQIKRHQSEEEIRDFCLRWAQKADLILFNATSSLESLGSMGELTAAFLKGVPIIGFNETYDELYPWELSYCNRMFYGIEAHELAMEYIYEYYIKSYD